MPKIVSALVAVITAAAAAYTAIKPLLASPTENGIAIAFLVWAVLSTAAHALSDYLPAWVLRVVGDVDGFVADVKKAKPGEAAAKAVTKTTLLIVLSFAALTAGCASTPCGKLENAIKYGEQGQAVVNAVCACLSFDATAAQICEAEAAAFAFTDAQAKAAYAQFCTASDAGMKATPKLRTKEEFDAWFSANGAAKVSK